MPHGYNGKILHVDLTSGALTVEEPPSRIVAMSFCEPRSWTRVLSS